MLSAGSEYCYAYSALCCRLEEEKRKLRDRDKPGKQQQGGGSGSSGSLAAVAAAAVASSGGSGATTASAAAAAAAASSSARVSRADLTVRGRSPGLRPCPTPQHMHCRLIDNRGCHMSAAPSPLPRSAPDPPPTRSRPAPLFPRPRPAQNVRVVQPNLVYAVGLALDICTEEALRGAEFFGAYGRTLKVSVNRGSQYSSALARHGPTGSAYVTFKRPEGACVGGPARCGAAAGGVLSWMGLRWLLLRWPARLLACQHCQ